MTSERIPVLDLKRQYQEIGAELEARVLEVLRSGHYILGPNLAELEKSVAGISGCSHGVGVANGTDALVLALWALGIGPGDEVITPAFTFAATAEAIGLRGARAVFVDIEAETFNIDADLIEPAITGRTRAVLPVHLYGQPARMDKITDIARRHGLKVIEDNAQAIGALYKGSPTGSFGDAACTSFYPTKNLGACGDAGLIVTNSPEVAERLKVLRAHGSRVRYYHDEIGVNSRLDEIQAAALITKIPHLASWNEKRREVARLYTEQLKDCPGVITPKIVEGAAPVWHQYTIRIQARARDQVQDELAKRKIDSMCYYPLPLHLQPAFASSGYKRGDFPVAEAMAREVLSLPMYPELEEFQIRRVAACLKDILAQDAACPGIATQAAPVGQ